MFTSKFPFKCCDWIFHIDPFKVKLSRSHQVLYNTGKVWIKWLRFSAADENIRG